jgi:adenylate cyclase
MTRFWRRVRRIARRFGFARLFCLFLLVGLAALRIADPRPIEELRLRTFDIYQVIEPRKKTARTPPVVIVDLDDRSLAKYGHWPWPRTRVADLVAALNRLGTAAIGFDILFSEPDRMTPTSIVDTFHELDEETKTKLLALPSNDQVLASAIAKSRVVLGETGLLYEAPDLDTSLPTTPMAMLGGEPQPFLVDYDGLLRNVKPLEQAAAGRGVISFLNERDGIVRRVPMILQTQGIMMPSLTLEILRVLSGTDTVLVKMDKAIGIKSVGVRGFEIPTDSNAHQWIHFAHYDPSIYVSASDVLDGAVPPGHLTNRIALIGTSAVGLNDLKNTPIDRGLPGVEVHAQILESVLSRSVLSRPSWGLDVELFAAFVLGLIVIAVAPLFGPTILFLFGTVILALLVGTSWYYYTSQRILLDFTYPLISSAAIYLTLVFSSYFREQSQRRQIRSAFSQYLSPALVAQLAQSPEKLVLGGEQRVMTFMFSDMRGFTSISEFYKEDPQGLTALMNRFLTPLTNAILKRKGTIDKYMGDAIMAFWNAPLDDADHAVNAVEAAIDMIGEIEKLNTARAEEAVAAGVPALPLNIGVGLNSGACVVGNMGSDIRFDYSVFGDSVNLASRLEGQSKNYGFPIIAGSNTAMAVKDRYAILEIDFIMVKGKKDPEVIYAVMGREDMAKSARFQALRNLMIEMLANYRSRNWEETLASIARGRASDEANTLELLYEIYEERIREFQQNPPPDDWDGAFALTTK